MQVGLFFSFWFYPLAGLASFLMARRLEPQVPTFWFLLWIPLGILIWTWIEYTLHRFVFHWQPRNRRLRRFLAQLHLRHHADTHKAEEILVKPLFSIPVSGFLFAFFFVIGGLTFSVGVLLGIWMGFLYYEAVHFRVHLGKKSEGLLQLQRRQHFIHHFIDDASCFGVTTPLWDMLFGTYRRLQK